MKEDNMIEEKHPHHHHHDHGYYPYMFGYPLFMKHKKGYRPWYDTDADYNTNSKSYYDFLARGNGELTAIIDLLNRVARRNIEVVDTDSVDLTKHFDWISESDCDNYHDVIKLQADVKLSNEKLLVNIDKLKVKQYELKNALKIFEDGMYSPDYLPVLESIANEISDIWSEIKKILDRLEKNESKLIELETLIKELIIKIEAIGGGGKFTPLEKGKDYEIKYFNNFYEKDDTTLSVGIIDLSDTVIIRLRNVLKHDDLKTDFVLKHSDVANDSPKARIMQLIFKGDYSFLNDSKIVEQDCGGLWNVSPIKARASFNMGGSLYNYNGDKLTLMGVSYFDGYNTQFTVYDDKVSLGHGNNTCRFTILKEDKK